MKAPQAPTLSAHLLAEAQRFLIYPGRQYRTAKSVEGQAVWDEIVGRFLEWRRTFLPVKHTQAMRVLENSAMLDEFYCREALRNIPGMVDRTRKLASLTLEGIPDQEAMLYLREAAQCYILDLPQAAVALSRAAMETGLRRVLAAQFGSATVAQADLKVLLSDLARRGKGLLSRDGFARAETVRKAANDVLHERPTNAEAALATLDAARGVLRELNSR